MIGVSQEMIHPNLSFFHLLIATGGKETYHLSTDCIHLVTVGFKALVVSCLTRNLGLYNKVFSEVDATAASRCFLVSHHSAVLGFCRRRAVPRLADLPIAFAVVAAIYTRHGGQ